MEQFVLWYTCAYIVHFETFIFYEQLNNGMFWIVIIDFQDDYKKFIFPINLGTKVDCGHCTSNDKKWKI